MYVIISPAKTIDTKTQTKDKPYTQPLFPLLAQDLAEILKSMSVDDIRDFLKISLDLAELNYMRHMNWSLPFSIDNAKQALFSFKGDVYLGLDAMTLADEALHFAQQKLFILSGLYGILRPFDLIQPYRLEMGKKLKNNMGKDLYAFWKPILTDFVSKTMKEAGDNTMVNLASNEYFKSIDAKKLKANIITPSFKELRNDKLTMITFYAKKARGLMTRFIIENQLTNVEDIKAFDYEGYCFNTSVSDEKNWVFTR